MSWTTVTAPTRRWVPVSSVLTTVDYGVDFRVLLKEQGYASLTNDRPFAITALLPEGKP